MDNDKKNSEKCERAIKKERDKIAKIYQKIKELQEKCPHYGLTKKYFADTGNYCRQDDEHWAEFNCPYCGKSWRANSYDKEEYLRKAIDLTGVR